MCDAHTGRKYAKAKNITTSETCEVFDEEIVYLFYGRPSFKYKVKPGSTTNLAPYPVCFVFTPKILHQIKRLYPIDSGALEQKVLDKFIYDKIERIDFEMEPEGRRISDIILHFHGGNEDYLNYRINNNNIDPGYFESIAYAEMHKSFGRDISDERRVTIEAQFDNGIKLTTEVIEAIILPRALLDSIHFRRFVDELDVNVEPYDSELWDPSQSFALVAGAAKNYLQRTGRRA